MHLADVVRELPRRAHGLTRKTVRDSQRWRLLEAITEVVARVGYAETSVADVIEVATVSRKAFYEHFRDKEDCFLAAYDFLSDRLVDSLVAVGKRYAAGAPRRRAQVTAFVTAMSADPLAARVFMVDVLGGGPRALRRRERVNASFGDAVLGARVDDVMRAAIVGGVNNVVGGVLLDGAVGRLPELVDPLCAFVENALQRRGQRSSRTR